MIRAGFRLFPKSTANRILAMLVFLQLPCPSAFPASEFIGSINVDRITFMNLNIGQFIYADEDGAKHRVGKGFQYSINPGLASGNLQIGYGAVDYSPGYITLIGGFSGDLLIGRTYLFDSIYRKNSLYYGIQFKAWLVYVPVRLGLLYSEKENFGINIGIGIGS